MLSENGHITLTNRQLAKLWESNAIKAVGSDECRRKMSPRMSFSLSKVLRAVTQAVEDFYEERNRLVRDCGDRDADGNLIGNENGGYKITDRREEFVTKVDQLADIRVSLNVSMLDLKVSALPAGVFNPVDLAALADIINFVED